MKTDSVLEKVLNSGNLAVTSECGPPPGRGTGQSPAEGRNAQRLR